MSKNEGNCTTVRTRKPKIRTKELKEQPVKHLESLMKLNVQPVKQTGSLMELKEQPGTATSQSFPWMLLQVPLIIVEILVPDTEVKSSLGNRNGFIVQECFELEVSRHNGTAQFFVDIQPLDPVDL